MTKLGFYQDKVIVITGASSGIGAELARQLARQKAKLVLASIDIGELKRVADECVARGAEATYKGTDVSKRLDCESLIQHAISRFERIDVLVNNAGVSMWSTLDELTDLSVIERVMDINYFGSVYCTYYALKYLKAASGQIVITNSEAGKTGVPARTGYSGSKFALNGFFDSLRVELAPFGVTVTSVYPGFVSTGLHSRFIGPDGVPINKTDTINQRNIMTPEKCVNKIIGGMSRRKREIVFSTRARLAPWMKLILPGVVDNQAARALRRGK